MKIGFSLSRCIRDIVFGHVCPDDVVAIIARTRSETRDAFGNCIDQYLRMGEFSCPDGSPRTHDPMSIALYLYDAGRIHQPRNFGGFPRVPDDRLVWMDLFPTNVREVSNTDQVQKTWDTYRMALKLSISNPLPSEKEAEAVNISGFLD